MSQNLEEKNYPIEEALRAQKALRDLAGLNPELFPVQAFVGMISDEIETLRNQGHSDEQIASVVSSSSSIALTAEEVGRYYASPEERHQHGD